MQKTKNRRTVVAFSLATTKTKHPNNTKAPIEGAFDLVARSGVEPETSGL